MWVCVSVGENQIFQMGFVLTNAAKTNRKGVATARFLLTPLVYCGIQLQTLRQQIITAKHTLMGFGKRPAQQALMWPLYHIHHMQHTSPLENFLSDSTVDFTKTVLHINMQSCERLRGTRHTLSRFNL